MLKIARDGKVTTFFDATELEVHAIAPAPQGGVATSPDGKIYSVAADGSSKTLFDPEDKYIWALAADPSGTLFAATGDKGVIYKITPDGKGSRFYKTSATNVVSIAVAKSGELIAGTNPPAVCSGSTPRARRSSSSTPPTARFTRSDRGRRQHLRGGRERDPFQRIQRSAVRLAADAGRSVVPSVSTEITGMTVVDTGMPSGPTTPAAGRSARRPAAARSTASRPTVSGTRSGRPPRTRPTISSSRTAAACWSGPEPTGRSSG